MEAQERHAHALRVAAAAAAAAWPVIKAGPVAWRAGASSSSSSSSICGGETRREPTSGRRAAAAAARGEAPETTGDAAVISYVPDAGLAEAAALAAAAFDLAAPPQDDEAPPPPQDEQHQNDEESPQWALHYAEVRGTFVFFYALPGGGPWAPLPAPPPLHSLAHCVPLADATITLTGGRSPVGDTHRGVGDTHGDTLLVLDSTAGASHERTLMDISAPPHRRHRRHCRLAEIRDWAMAMAVAGAHVASPQLESLLQHPIPPSPPVRPSVPPRNSSMPAPLIPLADQQSPLSAAMLPSSSSSSLPRHNPFFGSRHRGPSSLQSDSTDSFEPNAASAADDDAPATDSAYESAETGPAHRTAFLSSKRRSISSIFLRKEDQPHTDSSPYDREYRSAPAINPLFSTSVRKPSARTDSLNRRKAAVFDTPAASPSSSSLASTSTASTAIFGATLPRSPKATSVRLKHSPIMSSANGKSGSPLAMLEARFFHAHSDHYRNGSSGSDTADQSGIDAMSRADSTATGSDSDPAWKRLVRQQFLMSKYIEQTTMLPTRPDSRRKHMDTLFGVGDDQAKQQADGLGAGASASSAWRYANNMFQLHGKSKLLTSSIPVPASFAPTPSTTPPLPQPSNTLKWRWGKPQTAIDEKPQRPTDTAANNHNASDDFVDDADLYMILDAPLAVDVAHRIVPHHLSASASTSTIDPQDKDAMVDVMECRLASPSPRAKKLSHLIPVDLEACLTAVEDLGVRTEGLYRVPGSGLAVDRVRAHLKAHPTPTALLRRSPTVDSFGATTSSLNTDTTAITTTTTTTTTSTSTSTLSLNDSSQTSGVQDRRKSYDTEVFGNDVNVLGSLVKSMCRAGMHNEPISTYRLYPGFIRAAQLDDEKSRLVALQDMVHMLPDAQFVTLERVCRHLCAVAGHAGVTRMSVRNLAIVFGPTLFNEAPYEYERIDNGDGDDHGDNGVRYRRRMLSTVDLAKRGAADASVQSLVVETLIMHVAWVFGEKMYWESI